MGQGCDSFLDDLVRVWWSGREAFVFLAGSGLSDDAFDSFGSGSVYCMVSAHLNISICKGVDLLVS